MASTETLEEMTENHEENPPQLELNLFRLRRVGVNFSKLDSHDYLGSLAVQINRYQEEILNKIQEFIANFACFYDGINKHGRVRKAANGITQPSLRELRKDHNNIVTSLHDALLNLVQLFPAYEKSEVLLEDHELADCVRDLEREAESVFVMPMRNIAVRFLESALRIKSKDGNRTTIPIHLQMNRDTLTREELERCKVTLVRNEPSIFYNELFNPAAIADQVNAVKGQMEGHVSRFLKIIFGSQLTHYVTDIRDNFSRIRSTYVPRAMGTMQERLQDIVSLEDAVYSLRTGKGRKVSMKDEAIRAATTEKGRLLMFYKIMTDFVELDPNYLDESQSTYHTRVSNVARIVQKAIRNLELFSGMIEALPKDIKSCYQSMQEEFFRSLQTANNLIRMNDAAANTASKAVRPLIGLISFSPDGQDQFYAKWLPVLRYMADFELQRYKDISQAIETVSSERRAILQDRDKWKEMFKSRINDDVAHNLVYGNAVKGGTSPDDLSETLANFYCFIDYVMRVHGSLLGFEREIIDNANAKLRYVRRAAK